MTFMSSFTETYPWTPARSFCHPTDLRFTHGTANPVASFLLHDDYVASRTVHCISFRQHFLQYR